MYFLLCSMYICFSVCLYRRWHGNKPLTWLDLIALPLIKISDKQKLIHIYFIQDQKHVYLFVLDCIVMFTALLFMMFVNDIIASINTNINGSFSIDEMRLFLILFADDQVLFATSITSLQSVLNDIETYCTSWGLKINVAKTKVLIFE